MRHFDLPESVLFGLIFICLAFSALSHSLPLQIHGLYEEHSSWPVTQSLLAENSVFSRKVCFLCPKIALFEILLLSLFFFFWCTPCWPLTSCLCLSNTAVRVVCHRAQLHIWKDSGAHGTLVWQLFSLNVRVFWRWSAGQTYFLSCTPARLL